MKPAKVQFSNTTLDVQWNVEGLRVHDRLSEAYSMEVALCTLDLGCEPSQLLGQSASVVIERDALHQELAGIVERVSEGELRDHELHVTLTIVPALMALTMRRNSRIFQEQTIPEILKAVLGEGLGAYERRVDAEGLTADYAAQEYTVQYRETDYDFAHRLMEENGIGYRFESEGGIETMVLFDDGRAFGELSSVGNADGVLPVREVGGDPGLHEDAQLFERTSRLRPTVARTVVFDWHVPRPLQDGEQAAAASLAGPNGAAVGPEREDYDHLEPSTLYGYRSQPLAFGQVQRQLELRRDLHQRDAVRCQGHGTATQLAPGLSFELLDHPREDLGGEYLVVGVEHLYGRFAAEGAEASSPYRNRFECIPSSVPWRPDRRRTRPRLAGIQTATVVGPSGSEIHTDEHGRIKVQFHWDREGAFTGDASCFVRVVQPWAGNGWGTMFIPRVGMEVTVTFVDGDPDRPIVTGCLYNGANPPPYGPGDCTKASIKSNSSPGGGGANELRLDDAAGAEEVYIHAQKDMNQDIVNDHNTKIGNNQTITVMANQIQEIKGNQDETVDGNQTMTVKANQAVTVQANSDLSVLGSMKSKVSGAVQLGIDGGQTTDIKGGLTETVLGPKTGTITGALTQTVNGAATLTHNGAVTQTVSGAFSLTAVSGLNLTAPAGMTITAPGGINIIDPTSLIEIHSIIDKTAGYEGSATGFSFALKGGSLSVTGLAIGVTGINLSAVGINVARKGIDDSNDGISFGKAGMKLLSAGIGMYMYALTMFN